jgi:hypothetical protein
VCKTARLMFVRDRAGVAKLVDAVADVLCAIP